MEDRRDILSHAYWNGTIKMGLSKFFILYVLHDRPMHGYEVAREVANVTKGCCSPTEGTIYPILRAYEDDGCVTSHEDVVNGRRRRIYTLTHRGGQAFQVAFEAWMEITNCLRGSGSMAAEPSTNTFCAH